MAAVYVPVAEGLLGGRRGAGGPVVDVAGHEQSELQNLRAEHKQLGLMDLTLRDDVSLDRREPEGPAWKPK